MRVFRTLIVVTAITLAASLPAASAECVNGRLVASEGYLAPRGLATAQAKPEGNGHVDIAQAKPEGNGHLDFAAAKPEGNGHVDLASASSETTVGDAA